VLKIFPEYFPVGKSVIGLLRIYFPLAQRGSFPYRAVRQVYRPIPRLWYGSNRSDKGVPGLGHRSNRSDKGVPGLGYGSNRSDKGVPGLGHGSIRS
jgi:hypothetical protein